MQYVKVNIQAQTFRSWVINKINVTEPMNSLLLMTANQDTVVRPSKPARHMVSIFTGKTKTWFSHMYLRAPFKSFS